MLSTFGEKVVFGYYHFCMKDGLYIMHGTAQTLIRETQQLKECRERFLAVTDWVHNMLTKNGHTITMFWESWKK
jgi:hypothetical protein